MRLFKISKKNSHERPHLKIGIKLFLLQCFHRDFRSVCEIVRRGFRSSTTHHRRRLLLSPFEIACMQVRGKLLFLKHHRKRRKACSIKRDLEGWSSNNKEHTFVESTNKRQQFLIGLLHLQEAGFLLLNPALVLCITVHGTSSNRSWQENEPASAGFFVSFPPS